MPHTPVAHACGHVADGGMHAAGLVEGWVEFGNINIHIDISRMRYSCQESMIKVKFVMHTCMYGWSAT